jgi:hypothetical protein
MSEQTDTPTEREQALGLVVREVEAHAARTGWDQAAQLFALVETEDLLRREPQLAALLGVEEGGGGLFTPVEQEQVGADLEELLAQILWPPEVDGAAAVVERLVLPPGADGEIPEDPEAAAAYAAEHPERQEVRLVAAVLRTGESCCALRLRSHDEDASVVVAPDLVPALLELLHATFEPEAGEPDDE